jgi:hypothetical protein
MGTTLQVHHLYDTNAADVAWKRDGYQAAVRRLR